MNNGQNKAPIRLGAKEVYPPVETTKDGLNFERVARIPLGRPLWEPFLSVVSVPHLFMFYINLHDFIKQNRSYSDMKK